MRGAARKGGPYREGIRGPPPTLDCRSTTLRGGSDQLPWCTTPIEAESSLGPDSHHPIISVSGIPSAVMVLRNLHPILASTLCAANPLARIAEPTIGLVAMERCLDFAPFAVARFCVPLSFAEPSL